MSNQKLQPVRVINEKGMVLWIAPHLLTPQYMHRHKLVRADVEPQEDLKPLEQVNLTVLKEKTSDTAPVESASTPVEQTTAPVESTRSDDTAPVEQTIPAMDEVAPTTKKPSTKK